MDELIEGGFPKGSVVLVAGGPGTGKTIFGLQFICEGAKRGERGLYVSFEESKEELLTTADTLNLKLRDYVEKGLVSILCLPQERVSEALKLLKHEAEERGVERLVIDSLSSLLVNAMELSDLYQFGVLGRVGAGMISLPLSDEMVQRREVLQRFEELKA